MISASINSIFDQFPLYIIVIERRLTESLLNPINIVKLCLYMFHDPKYSVQKLIPCA